MESSVVMKMEKMNLDELLGLLWSALEIGKGSDTFFNQLENELNKRLLKVKDEEFQVLLSCFEKHEESPIFNARFIRLILKVISEKKDRFTVKTLVHIIWSLAKLSFNDDSVTDLLLEMKAYPRLSIALEGMYQKSLCMLLWTYSRNEKLNDPGFLSKIIVNLLNYQG